MYDMIDCVMMCDLIKMIQTCTSGTYMYMYMYMYTCVPARIGAPTCTRTAVPRKCSVRTVTSTINCQYQSLHMHHALWYTVWYQVGCYM